MHLHRQRARANLPRVAGLRFTERVENSLKVIGDFYLARWKGGTDVVRFQDDVYKSLTPADLKQ